MEVKEITNITCLQKKKDTLILKGSDLNRDYLIKAVSRSRPDLLEAIRDEYCVMKEICHPSIPRYFHCESSFSRDGKDYLALFMEYLEGRPLSGLVSFLSPADLLSILAHIGDLIDYLRKCGLIYTDLNPGNILVRKEQAPSPSDLSLVDYTGAWFYRKNPRPGYRLRFSYQFSGNLPANQLLVRELALMLNAILNQRDLEKEKEKKEDSPLPSFLYTVLETGLHPAASLSLSDYTDMVRSCAEKFRTHP